MWNQYNTDAVQGMVGELITYPGNNGDQIHAYCARPDDSGRHPGIVLVHHMPGWDELYLEFARRLAQHGYAVICPDLYCRYGHGTPDDVAAKVRGDGGIADDSVVGDLQAAAKWLRARPDNSGKVGIIGTCSGGRHAYLTACRTPGGFDVLGNLWGGGVVMGESDLNPKQPVAPISLTKDLTAPVISLSGNDDKRPSPEQVDQLEAELKKHGKTSEFHRYDGAGHAFFYHDRGAYRQEQAMDGWAKVFAFFGKYLQG